MLPSPPGSPELRRAGRQPWPRARNQPRQPPRLLPQGASATGSRRCPAGPEPRLPGESSGRSRRGRAGAAPRPGRARQAAAEPPASLPAALRRGLRPLAARGGLPRLRPRRPPAVRRRETAQRPRQRRVTGGTRAREYCHHCCRRFPPPAQTNLPPPLPLVPQRPEPGARGPGKRGRREDPVSPGLRRRRPLAAQARWPLPSLPFPPPPHSTTTAAGRAATTRRAPPPLRMLRAKGRGRPRARLRPAPVSASSPPPRLRPQRPLLGGAAGGSPWAQRSRGGAALPGLVPALLPPASFSARGPPSGMRHPAAEGSFGRPREPRRPEVCPSRQANAA